MASAALQDRDLALLGLDETDGTLPRLETETYRTPEVSASGTPRSYLKIPLICAWFVLCGKQRLHPEGSVL